MISLAIKSIDLFSLPFYFNISDNKKHKKTLFGGWISLLIICLSIAYLSYLCNIFFGNQLQPTISLRSKKLNEQIKLTILENNIAFKVQLKDGKDFGDYEQGGTVYFQLIAVYTEQQSNGLEVSKIIPTKPCQDDEQIGFYCLDLQTFNQGRNYLNLSYYPDEFEKEKLQLLFLYCEPFHLKQGQRCAKEDDPIDMKVYKEILNISTKVFVRITTYQYSPNKKEYEKKIKQERFYLTGGSVLFSRIFLQRTSSSLSTGLIIQNTKKEDYLSDYTRLDTTNSMEFVQEEYKLRIIAVCQIMVSDTETEQNIQYPQFTYILAQFTSVFNSMLIVGVICKSFAQSEIVQDFIELQLKVQYKQAALDILQKFGKEKSKKQNIVLPKLGLFNLYQRIQTLKINSLKTKEFTINPYQNLKQKIHNFFDCCFYRYLCRCLKKKKAIRKDSQETMILKTVLNNSRQVMDIFEIQKEITKIKMMLKMLLTVEQYSAIQLCGVNIDLQPEKIQQVNQMDQSLQKDETILIKEGDIIQIFTEKSQTKIKNNVNQNENMNEKILSGEKLENKQNELETLLSQQSHLDKIELVEKDQNYFQQSLERYFANNQFKSELDQRILGSMIGTAEQKLNDIKNMQNKSLEDKPK